MILGLHVKSPNCGDSSSCPLLYFPFEGHEVRIESIRETEVTELPYKPELVIYGGGSIISSANFYSWKCKTVAWGVGHHERKRPWGDAMNQAHRVASRGFDLYFPRDGIKPFYQVPCASCMHPVFDEEIEIKHKVVRYSAKRRIMVDDYKSPHLTNQDGSIEDAVRFLGSGETVITSSYHGAYWASLLGRKVELIPWGSKFEYLPKMPLEMCRGRNMNAYEKILNLLNG